MKKQRERCVLNLDQNIQKGINRVKSQFFEAASDGKLTFKTCLKQFLSKNRENSIRMGTMSKININQIKGD